MSWLSPRTLRGWFVLIVMGALLLSQLVSLALMLSQQTILRSSLHEVEALGRAESIVNLARNADDRMLRNIEITASSPTFIVSFGKAATIRPEDSNRSLAASLARSTGSPADAVRVAWDSSKAVAITTVVRHESGGRTIIIARAEDRNGNVRTLPPVAPPAPPIPPVPPVAPEPPKAELPHDVELLWEEEPRMVQKFEVRTPAGESETETVSPIPERLGISIRLKPDLWLNVAAVPASPPSIIMPLILAGLFAAVLVGVAAVWAAGRVARPIAGLTQAADLLGKGDAVVMAPEEGPDDVKVAARAFNAMATRLRRLISDQRALLSAVGHDLRTPIASLRIRTELVKDPELQSKMLASLEEMQRLTDAALAAARGGETGEPTRAIDLQSLVEAVCDDLSDTGNSVTTGSLCAARTQGRASELRRALRNLIENAIRYACAAQVSMQQGKDQIDLCVEDSGPGIPETQLDQVTKPFVRLEESRNTETGGHGLGLTIARAIAERHSGQLILENRKEGGLRATLRLPLSETPAT